jgi:segregation and condensation protein B
MPSEDREERPVPEAAAGESPSGGTVSLPIEVDTPDTTAAGRPPQGEAAVQDAEVADARVQDAAVQDVAVETPATPPGLPATGGEDALGPSTGTDEPATVDTVMRAAAADASVSEQLVAIVEALVFASPEPITFKALQKLLDTEPKDDVRAALAELMRRYEARGGGLQLLEVAGGYQIVTRPELHEWVRRMFHERTTQKLSVQALETVAVIAYKQPITAAEITDIRGVNTSGVIGTLLERGLVKIAGRKQVVGRPFLYATTRDFLDRFGLRDLNDLPKVEDMAEALGFEVPAGIATDAPSATPAAEEPATEEDAAVLSGEDHDAEDSETESGN